MQYCTRCQHHIAEMGTVLCRPCLTHQWATILWPHVRAALPAVNALCLGIDSSRLKQARRTLFTTLAQIPVETNATPGAPGVSQDQMMQQAEDLLTAYHAAVKRYLDEVAHESPALEFHTLFLLAREKRQHYRALVWRRWGFDVKRCQWRPGHFPITAAERAAWLSDCLSYRSNEHLLLSGLITLGTRLQMEAPLQEALREAAQRMRSVELDSTAQDLPALHEGPGT